jgi:hypothetical protein
VFFIGKIALGRTLNHVISRLLKIRVAVSHGSDNGDLAPIADAVSRAINGTRNSSSSLKRADGERKRRKMQGIGYAATLNNNSFCVPRGVAVPCPVPSFCQRFLVQ